MPDVNWDQTQVNDAREANFDPLPRGKYLCRVVSSAEKQTKDKNGAYFEFEFTVEKGDFKNRKLWARLNIRNQSEVAQRIGREQFKSLCKAAGKENAKTTESLHDKLVVCYVVIEKGDQRGDINRITGFESPEKFAAEGSKTPTRATATAGGEDDDIPF